MQQVLITGGTGSVAGAIVERLLADPAVERIAIYSRDEHKQGDMMQRVAERGTPFDFFLGDICDEEALFRALAGIDTVIHTAAMRLVPHAEANPAECHRINVGGANALTRAVGRSDVSKVVAISSDKAVAPSTIYGTTKFAMERILVDADKRQNARYSLLRYANVIDTRSSVAPLFLKQKESGVLTITDPDMTRFSIAKRDGVDLVMTAVTDGLGGDIFMPISPSYRVGDMAEAIAPDAEHRIIGSRPGEKMHEIMFSMVESPQVVKRGANYVFLPRTGRWDVAPYCEQTGATKLETLFEYGSGDNDQWLSVDDIRRVLRDEGMIA